QLASEAVGVTAQTSFPLVPQEGAASRRIIRDVTQTHVRINEWQPLVHLRNVAAHGLELLLEDGTDVDNYVRLKWVWLLELVADVHRDRVGLKALSVRADAGDAHHVQRILGELTRVAVVGMVVPRSRE